MSRAIMIAAAAVLRIARKIDARSRTVNKALTAAALIVTLAKDTNLTGAASLSATGTVGSVGLGVDTGLSALNQAGVTSPAANPQAANFGGQAIVSAASAIIRVAGNVDAGPVTQDLARTAARVVIVASTEKTSLSRRTTV